MLNIDQIVPILDFYYIFVLTYEVQNHDKRDSCKTIEIEADSLKEAEYAATKLYHNCDIVLSADDYDTTEIFAL